MDAVEVSHVAKRFGQVHALRDVSLRVTSGSIFGFLGPNGAGKTTTMRGLLGLMRFDAGSASVLGLDPWRDRVELHANVGYLPSGMGMYRGMRGIDLLDYVAALETGEARRSPHRGEVLDALQLSLADLRRPVQDYSKGMRQKLALVQCLQHDPQLVVMDEPNEGLDPLVQHAVYDLLRERVARGRTVLFSSHTLSEVEELCEEVAIIREGSLVVQATLEELRESRPRVVRLGASDEALAGLDEAFVARGRDHVGRALYDVQLEPAAIVRALVGIELQDLVVEEPSLEHIFRSYYSGGEED